MTKLRLIFLALALLLPSAALRSQDQYSSGFGLDPSDAAALKQIRKKMDKVRSTKHRPTVALVLGGGGAKGAAHVGAIKYIESLGIPVDMVLGTSIGGLVGGMYALGYNGEYLDSLVKSMDWDLMLSDKIDRGYIPVERRKYLETFALSFPFYYSEKHEDDQTRNIDLSASREGESLSERLLRGLPSGMVQGQNVNNLFSSICVGYADSLNFFELPIPYVCVASDMVSCRAKIWHSGDIVKAMRSTMSIPGLFTPVRGDGMVLTDGGMRNNFPVDLAVQMGADLVIGIELSDAQKDFNAVNNLLDIVWQGIDMLGNDSFRRNLEIVDVKIKPDLHEFNMMSFNTVAVDSIMRRGYYAARDNDAGLQKIKRLTAKGKNALQGPRALDVNIDPVMIDKIEFVGISPSDERHIRKHLSLQDNHLVNRRLIEKGVAEIYGMGSFDQVSYRLSGTGEPYKLKMLCKKGPIHQLGAGIRLDSEEMVAVLFNLGFNVHSISGSALDLNVKIGSNPYASAKYSYRTPEGTNFNAYANIRHTSSRTYGGILGSSRFQFDYLTSRQELFISGVQLRDFNFEAGLRNDYFNIGDLLSSDPVTEYDITDINNSYVSAFIRAYLDTYDHGYFPTSGLKINGGFNYVIGGINEKIKPFPEIYANIEAAFSPGEKELITLRPFAATRMVPGEDHPLPYVNLIGGTLSGRYLEQQIPFMGLNFATSTLQLLGLGGAEIRLNLNKNNFVSLIGNAGASASAFGDFFNADSAHYYVGAGLQYSYNSIIGPVKAAAFWSNITNSVGIHLSAGFDF